MQAGQWVLKSDTWLGKKAAVWTHLGCVWCNQVGERGSHPGNRAMVCLLGPSCCPVYGFHPAPLTVDIYSERLAQARGH